MVRDIFSGLLNWIIKFYFNILVEFKRKNIIIILSQKPCVIILKIKAKIGGGKIDSISNSKSSAVDNFFNGSFMTHIGIIE